MAASRRRWVARRQAASLSGRRLASPPPALPHVDACAAQLLRGLLVGLPIGIAMWLLLALLVWKLT